TVARKITLQASILTFGSNEITGLNSNGIYLDNNVGLLTVVPGQQANALVHDVPKIPTTISGNGVNGTLQGPDIANTWQITGGGAGTLDGSVTFSGIRNLSGGAGNDTFALTRASGKAGGTIAGTIDGGTGSNTLDDSGYTGN